MALNLKSCRLYQTTKNLNKYGFGEWANTLKGGHTIRSVNYRYKISTVHKNGTCGKEGQL